MISLRALIIAFALTPSVALASHPYARLQKFAVSEIKSFMSQEEIVAKLGPPDVIVQRSCAPPHEKFACPVWQYEASNAHDHVFRSLFVYFDTIDSNPFVWRVANWELR